jgi:hypothetical protein
VFLHFLLPSSKQKKVVKLCTDSSDVVEALLTRHRLQAKGRDKAMQHKGKPMQGRGSKAERKTEIEARHLVNIHAKPNSQRTRRSFWRLNKCMATMAEHAQHAYSYEASDHWWLVLNYRIINR